MRYMLALWFLLLAGCQSMQAPPPNGWEGVHGAPWGLTRVEDWKFCVLPGDTVIEVDHDGRLYKQTWGFECPGIHVPEGALRDDFSGVVYYDYGATLRIQELTFVKGVVEQVRFVPWRTGTEQARERAIVRSQPASPISDWPNCEEKRR